METISAHAVRNGNTIEVTVSGFIPNSCYAARVQDIYPGGSRVYITDPGAAQVFIEEAIKAGSELCAMVLTPWGATVSIPDKEHDKIEIFINNHEVLEVAVMDRKKSQFIVIALTGTTKGCSILPEEAMYLAIYTQVFGPATYDNCKNWVLANCGA